MEERIQFSEQDIEFLEEGKNDEQDNKANT